jgi:hypothetical protein
MGSVENQISFLKINSEEKIRLLEVLGYGIDDDGYILDINTGEPYTDPMNNEEVHIENASVLPGSTVIINTTPLSLSEYFTVYVEKAKNKL